MPQPQPQPETFADLRAQVAAAQHRAIETPSTGSWPTITKVVDAPVPPGWTMWRVGPEDGPCAVLPDLVDDAPLELRGRLLARVVAVATGGCPMCSAVAELTQRLPGPGEPGIAVWRQLPVHLAVRHDAGCPADFTDAERRWFTPFRPATDGGSTP